MPQEITRLPTGLLSLLGLKSGGITPQDVASQLVGVIDLTQLYLLNDRENVATGTIAALAVGANFYVAATAVPAGQLWYVWDYMVSVSAGAGAAADIAAGITYDGTSSGMLLGDYVSVAANQSVRARCNPRGFWAGAGSEFFVHCRSQTLTPAANGAIIITRLRI